MWLWSNVGLLIYCQSSVYLHMIHPRKSFLRGTRCGKAKMLYLRANILLSAVQPNLVSVVSQRISRRVISVWINICFLHFTGQQGTFGPGKGINHHHKRQFSSPSHCVYVQTFSSLRILCCTSPSTNTGSLHGKCCGLLLPLIPLPSFAYNCPSFLSHTQMAQMNC